MSVTLAMDGNYPDIYSGFITFLNTRTGAKVSLELPKDVEGGVYEISSVTVDTGASATIIPEKFGKRLGINRPAAGQKEYYVFSGVGGTSICFYSPEPIALSVSDGTENFEKLIMPFFLTAYSPSITSEGRLLASSEYQPYTEEVIHFISPPFQYCDKYTVKVHSPIEKFLPQNRRLKLDVDVGEGMDYILIGRDWQEEFELTFTAETIIIERKQMST